MKKKSINILLSLMMVLFACSAAGKPVTVAVQDTMNPTEPEKTLWREELCFRFISEHMLLSDGGVRTNYLDKTKNDELATGAEVLSESMGLWMLYTVEIQNRPLFDQSLSFIKKRLDTGSIQSYRYTPSAGAYPVNAFLDDMRIIRALLLAEEVFEGGYDEIAFDYADRLYRTNIAKNHVFDFFDEQSGVTSNFVTLCYPEFDTMDRLKEHDERWEAVYTEMLGIVKGGYLGDEFPMYASTYYYENEVYSTNDISTVQSLLTVLNLAYIGECSQSSIDFIKRNTVKGTLFGSYGIDGTKKNSIESTAIYAICASIGKAVDDNELYNAAITQMNRFQVLNENNRVFGAFANAQTLDLYAFDNLMALLAYRAFK